MKIRLGTTLPVESRHGLKKGMVLEAKRDTERGAHPGAVWLTAPGSGERVCVLSREWEPASTP